MDQYEGAYSGKQIDEAIRRVLSGELSAVKSFNGRIGAVVPQNGDYSAGMVGAATPEQLQAAFAQTQPKLTGQPGQVVGFDGTGAAAAVRGWSNPNLLDNWYFPDPINQCGTESGALWGQYAYGIDRWMSFNAGLTKWVKGEGTYLLPGNSVNAIIEQRMDAAMLPDGTTLTLSALVNGQLISLTFVVEAGKNINEEETAIFVGGAKMVLQFWTTKPGNGVYTARVWKMDVDHTVLVEAVKVEPGPISTLAYQDADGSWVLNDPTPDKTLELEKCQKYQYNPLYNASGHYNKLGIGWSTSTNRVIIVMSIPISMRAAPTVTNLSNMHLRDTATNTFYEVESASADANSITSGSISISCTPQKAVPVGRMFSLETIDDTSAKGTMLLDANP